MIVLRHHEVMQEKLNPEEWDSLRHLTERPRFHRFEAPVYDLESNLNNRLRPQRKWLDGAIDLYRRITKISAFSADKCGYVRMALHTGPMPHLVLTDVNIPTSCLVFDLPNGVVRQGWMNSGNAISGMEEDVPHGMKIAWQPAVRQVYEDWVGTGPSPTVVPSASPEQCERELSALLAQEPVRSSLPPLSAPLQAVL